MNSDVLVELDSTPFRPAHAAVEADGVHRLADSAAVLRRYRARGPHATVVMPIATPGRVGDNMEKRWSATRADLRHLGADESILEHLDVAVAALPPSGYEALVTANPDGAAYCWLLTPSGPLMRVGSLPSLVPALAEVERRRRVVVAAVDRVGADISIVDHAQIETVTSVDGDTEGIHKSAGDGHDQARRQRHSEVVWERNACEVAKAIGRLVRKYSAPFVVLSGDLRAIHLVAERLAGPNVTVYSAHAGGRHEPQTTQRLLAAAIAAETAAQDVARQADLDLLTEELGQQDLAVDGEVHTLQAIADHRVAELFVDGDTWADRAHVDEAIRAAHADGAEVCIARGAQIADGVGALLRRPYHQDGMR